MKVKHNIDKNKYVYLYIIDYENSIKNKEKCQVKINNIKCLKNSEIVIRGSNSEVYVCFNHVVDGFSMIEPIYR